MMVIDHLGCWKMFTHSIWCTMTQCIWNVQMHDCIVAKIQELNIRWRTFFHFEEKSEVNCWRFKFWEFPELNTLEAVTVDAVFSMANKCDMNVLFTYFNLS